MKLISWNVNGIRAASRKGFLVWLSDEKPDVLCVQETKAREEQLDENLLSPPGYTVCWNSAERKGYSGVATFCRKKPRSVSAGIDVNRFDVEGRVLMTEHPNFNLLNIYFPNGTSGEKRVEYKLDFYDAALDYCEGLRNEGKELIICGDFNTAHQEIDLARPKENKNNSGFLPVEREKVDVWLGHGYVDVFRHFNRDSGQYTWWSYRGGARERNVGWRIDYFLITPGLLKSVTDAYLCPDVTGSDHCPVVLVIK